MESIFHFIFPECASGGRTRTCTTSTGCGDWDTVGSHVGFRTETGGSTYGLSISLARAGEHPSAQLELRTDDQGNPVADLLVWTRRLNWGVDGYYRDPDQLGAHFGNLTPRRALSDGTAYIGAYPDVRLGRSTQSAPPRMSGTFGAHCMRVFQRHSATDTSGTTTTSEMVIYGRY